MRLRTNMVGIWWVQYKRYNSVLDRVKGVFFGPRQGVKGYGAVLDRVFFVSRTNFI